MQTFLPFPDFCQSAQSLDRLRLGKQRLEVVQILKTLSGASSGWRNHPVVRAWDGHQWSLAAFGLEVCSEWVRRGYKDNQKEWLQGFQDGLASVRCPSPSPPPWFGHPEIHLAYRRLLVGKDPAWYGEGGSGLGWREEPLERLDYSMFELRVDNLTSRVATCDSPSMNGPEDFV